LCVIFIIVFPQAITHIRKNFTLIEKTKSFKEGVTKLNVVVYSLGAYVLTAIIAFTMVGVIVLLNRFMSRNNAKEGMK